MSFRGDKPRLAHVMRGIAVYFSWLEALRIWLQAPVRSLCIRRQRGASPSPYLFICPEDTF